MRSRICWRLYWMSSARAPSTRTTKVAPRRPRTGSASASSASARGGGHFRRSGRQIAARSLPAIAGQSMTRWAVEKPNFLNAWAVRPGRKLPTVLRLRAPGRAKARLCRGRGMGRWAGRREGQLVTARTRLAAHFQRTRGRLTMLGLIRAQGDAGRMPNVAKAQPSASGGQPDPAALLLEWWDRERRDLPWRTPPGFAPDAYRVWLSEIMLQQTTVKTVIPYYERFLARWPTVAALAAAPLDEVLAAWAGLGYYSRARNLHKCAKLITHMHGGRFPTASSELVKLPGIGPYTAAAIAAIAFGEAATPVDGNIERVMARLFAVTAPLPGSKPTLRSLAANLTPPARAGDFAQGLMDLGASICRPKRPSCLVCPLQMSCAAHAEGLATQLPRKPAKADRPLRVGLAFGAPREDGP